MELITAIKFGHELASVPVSGFELKIVFFVKRFYTNKDLIEDEFGRLFYFPSILKEKGYECVVFALDFKNRTEVNVSKNNVRFYSIPVKSFWRLPLMYRLFRELKTTKADFVFSSGDSYMGYLGLLLSKRLSSKAIFDIYDDYAFFGTNKAPFMQKMLRIAANKSDLVVCASESIRKKYSAYQKSILVVENGVDSQVFRPEEKRIARKKSNVVNEDIIVGYFGSIHRPRGADDLIEAIKQLRAKGQDVKLLMAGRDYGEVSLNYPWIDYRGMVEQKHLVAMINSCDVVAIPYKNTELISMTNACKLMEYIACSVPIVVSNVADYAGHFPKSFDCVSEPDDPASLARVIANQLKNKNVVDEKRVVSWEKLTSRLENNFRQLVC